MKRILLFTALVIASCKGSSLSTDQEKKYLVRAYDGTVRNMLLDIEQVQDQEFKKFGKYFECVMPECLKKTSGKVSTKDVEMTVKGVDSAGKQPGFVAVAFHTNSPNIYTLSSDSRKVELSSKREIDVNLRSRMNIWNTDKETAIKAFKDAAKEVDEETRSR